MRGLTPIERLALLESLDASDPNAPEAREANDSEREAFAKLIDAGRVHLVARQEDDWDLEEWRATNLGRLALRVCPVDE